MSDESDLDAMVDAVYESHWKPILEDEDGDIDFRTLKIELYNALAIMLEYAEVYQFVSDGLLSNSVRNALTREVEDFLGGE